MIHPLEQLEYFHPWQRNKCDHWQRKISAFTTKLSIWNKRIDCENYANLPKLDEVSSSTTSLPEHIVIQIKEHLQVLSQSFEGYFHYGGVSDLQR